jgi:hypothetical protein
VQKLESSCLLDDTVQIPEHCVATMLGHRHSVVRLASFSLLVSSPQSTNPLSPATLNAVRENLFHLCSETDASVRSRVLSLMQYLLDRLRAATLALSKAHKSLAKSVDITSKIQYDAESDKYTCELDVASTLNAHISFIDSIILFIERQLRPSAAYQRRICSLGLLSIILKSGLDTRVPQQFLSKKAKGQVKWPFSRNIATPSLRRSLLDLVMDPFDDIRSLAALCLKMTLVDSGDLRSVRYEKISGNLQHSSYEDSFLERCETLMLHTGRADHADGVARAYELLSYIEGQTGETKSAPHDDALPGLSILQQLVLKLEGIIKHALSDMIGAVNGHPMHGILASLRCDWS